MTFIFTLLLGFVQAATNCFPENNIQVPTFVEGAAIGWGQYNAAIEKIKNEFGWDVKELGGELYIINAWRENEVQAYADRRGSYFEMVVKGGMARYPGMTEDSLLLVFCHELGHHLGGAPLGLDFNGLTIEGQADYFATLKCLRRLFSADDNIAWVKQNQPSLPLSVIFECQQSFLNSQQQAICMRSLAAGKIVADITHEITKGKNAPQFETPDPTVVNRLFTLHPNPQCRLDTYYAGSICPVQSSLSMSNFDLDVGSCSRWLGTNRGARPLCWYDEKQNFIYPNELKKRESPRKKI